MVMMDINKSCSDNNMLCLVHRGGKLILQKVSNNKQENKKLEEMALLEFFTNSDCGKIWMQKHEVIDILPSESPDFILVNSAGKRIGLEMVSLVNTNSRSRVLATILQATKQTCMHFKEKDDINFRIIVNIFEESELVWPYRPWYEKMVRNLDCVARDIKDAFVRLLSQEPIMPFEVIKRMVNLQGCTFVVSYNIDDFMSWHVNGATMIAENPLNQVQKLIKDKDKKILSYLKKCDECYLLVIADSSSMTGNSVGFDNKLFKRKFWSEYEGVFFLGLDCDIENPVIVGNLKTSKPKKDLGNAK